MLTRKNHAQTNNIIQGKNNQYPKTLKKIAKLKQNNNMIIQNLRDIGEEWKAWQIENCANIVALQKIGNGERVVHGNFCKQRLCAICAWRKSIKWVAQTKPVLNKINLTRQNPRYIFITITIKNIYANEVNEALNNLIKAWDRFCKLKDIKEAFDGMIRSTEITYNAYKKTYHPHIHALILCNEKYFKETYISQKKLQKLWKQSAKLKYNPSVDIRAVTTENGIPEKATIETLKYAIKPTAYKIDPCVTQTLLYALKNRKLISYTGIFSKIRKELKLEDIEESTLLDRQVTTEPVILYEFTPAGWEIINE